MLMETVHIVQPFTRAARQGLLPKLAMQFKDPDEAAARAAGMADKYAGVIAYTMEVDEEAGDYGSPRILFQTGEVPDLMG